ncbi:hypothetical protein [Alcanivorax sp. DP30]|uniref:hypothetical protein n=1 Tax=Alcanivorax sp. DP30 TaxID=2606217 RepID=UPI00136C5E12|nr:hypothetical protein [Alcanivorax sp. DP30]MZR63041.1 hypothetical protein [Alcanivorax sp. DP30]
MACLRIFAGVLFLSSTIVLSTFANAEDVGSESQSAVLSLTPQGYMPPTEDERLSPDGVPALPNHKEAAAALAADSGIPEGQDVSPLTSEPHADARESLKGSMLKRQGEPVSSLPDWAWIAIISLSVTTFSAVLVSFYLYRWRKVLIASQDVLLPEELAKAVNRLSEAFGKLYEENQKFGEASNRNTVKITDGVKMLGRSLLTFQKSLEDKDQEIARFKDGYDTKILKRNLVGFTRLSLFIDGIEDESPEITNIRLLLEDALDDCGVEKFFPEIGANFKSAVGVEDRPKVEDVDDHSLDMKIIGVERPGFRLGQDGNSSSLVILKARVVVGRYKKENNND